jgi:hypothetical protein
MQLTVIGVESIPHCVEALVRDVDHLRLSATDVVLQGRGGLLLLPATRPPSLPLPLLLLLLLHRPCFPVNNAAHIVLNPVCVQHGAGAATADIVGRREVADAYFPSLLLLPP